VPIPLARETTFAQFRDHLLSIGCTYGSLTNVHTRDPLVYFENPTIGIVPPRDFLMKKLADDNELLPSFIRSACKQLQIDPAELDSTIHSR
jgi:hypothetical protein